MRGKIRKKMDEGRMTRVRGTKEEQPSWVACMTIFKNEAYLA